MATASPSGIPVALKKFSTDIPLTCDNECSVTATGLPSREVLRDASLGEGDDPSHVAMGDAS